MEIINRVDNRTDPSRFRLFSDKIHDYKDDLCNFDNFIVTIDIKDDTIKELQCSNEKKREYKNNNCCDYCYENIYIHPKSGYNYIDRCIFKYTDNSGRFFKSKDSHMLGTLLSLDLLARTYLETTCQELYSKYKVSYVTSDAKGYIVGGIIEQYIMRSITSDTSDKLELDRDMWLIMNNIRCDQCQRLCCPFHRDHNSFELRTVNSKNIYCCGWCIDTIDCMPQYDKNRQCSDIDLFNFELN